jgi:hypothetical protein
VEAFAAVADVSVVAFCGLVLPFFYFLFQTLRPLISYPEGSQEPALQEVV